MLWNGKLTPPETNSDGKNNKRFIKTRSGHELMFVDDPAAPLAELKLKDGKKLSLSKDGVEVTDGSQQDRHREQFLDHHHRIDRASSRSSRRASRSRRALRWSSNPRGTLTIKGSVVQIN